MQTIDNDDGATLASSGKKSQKGWSCKLCQVSATSEKGMRDHLNGKKHKAKEKAVHRTIKSVEKGSDESDIRVEETDKSIELAISTGTTGQNLSNIVGVNQGVNNVDASSHKQQHTETNAGSGLGKKHKKELKIKDTDFKFWCKICEVGTTSEALMTAHRAGKQHMSLLKERGGGVIAIKTMPDDVQYVDLTRNTPVNMDKEVVLGSKDGQGRVGVDELENADKGGVGVDELEDVDKCTKESH